MPFSSFVHFLEYIGDQDLRKKRSHIRNSNSLSFWSFVCAQSVLTTFASFVVVHLFVFACILSGMAALMDMAVGTVRKECELFSGMREFTCA